MKAMALEVVKGIQKTGANASIFTASSFQEDLVEAYDAIAFGCLSMGAEQLEAGG